MAKRPTSLQVPNGGNQGASLLSSIFSGISNKYAQKEATEQQTERQRLLEAENLRRYEENKDIAAANTLENTRRYEDGQRIAAAQRTEMLKRQGIMDDITIDNYKSNKAKEAEEKKQLEILNFLPIENSRSMLNQFTREAISKSENALKQNVEDAIANKSLYESRANLVDDTGKFTLEGEKLYDKTLNDFIGAGFNSENAKAEARAQIITADSTATNYLRENKQFLEKEAEGINTGIEKAVNNITQEEFVTAKLMQYRNNGGTNLEAARNKFLLDAKAINLKTAEELTAVRQKDINLQKESLSKQIEFNKEYAKKIKNGGEGFKGVNDAQWDKFSNSLELFGTTDKEQANSTVAFLRRQPEFKDASLSLIREVVMMTPGGWLLNKKAPSYKDIAALKENYEAISDGNVPNEFKNEALKRTEILQERLDKLNAAGPVNKYDVLNDRFTNNRPKRKLGEPVDKYNYVSPDILFKTREEEAAVRALNGTSENPTKIPSEKTIVEVDRNSINPPTQDQLDWWDGLTNKEKQGKVSPLQEQKRSINALQDEKNNLPRDIKNLEILIKRAEKAVSAEHALTWVRNNAAYDGKKYNKELEEKTARLEELKKLLGG